MALVAGSVLTETKGLLNDPTGSIYPDQALIPLLNKAYRELQTKLGALGIPVTREVVSNVKVDAGIQVISDGGGLPDDFLYPIEIGERLFDSMELFVKMEEREWEPNQRPQDKLFYWTWREESIKLVGALTTRELMLRYSKSLPTLSDVGSPIQITDSTSFLAQRTAALGALLLGVNASRAQALMADLYAPEGPWDDLRSTKVKRLQNTPVRRRRTRWRTA